MRATKFFFVVILPAAMVLGLVEYINGLDEAVKGDLCQPGYHPYCTPLILSLSVVGSMFVVSVIMILIFGRGFSGTKNERR